MISPELSRHGFAPEQTPRVEPRVQKHIVIATWAMSSGEPHLFYWRDHNSYDNDPYLTGDIGSEDEINEVARVEVVDSLVFEEIEEKRAKGAIKGVDRGGVIVFDFLEDGEKGIEWRTRRAPMVFVEVMPSVLKELTKKDAHLLFPAWVLKPNSKSNDQRDRRIEKAFKQFAAKKRPAS